MFVCRKSYCSMKSLLDSTFLNLLFLIQQLTVASSFSTVIGLYEPLPGPWVLSLYHRCCGFMDAMAMSCSPDDVLLLALVVFLFPPPWWPLICRGKEWDVNVHIEMSILQSLILSHLLVVGLWFNFHLPQKEISQLTDTLFNGWENKKRKAD